MPSNNPRRRLNAFRGFCVIVILFNVFQLFNSMSHIHSKKLPKHLNKTPEKICYYGNIFLFVSKIARKTN